MTGSAPSVVDDRETPAEGSLRDAVATPSMNTTKQRPVFGPIGQRPLPCQHLPVPTVVRLTRRAGCLRPLTGSLIRDAKLQSNSGRAYE
jgi:hypothetical protein